MRSRRALLAAAGGLVVGGCLGDSSGTPDGGTGTPAASTRDTPTSNPTDSASETPRPVCGTTNEPSEPYDLAVVATDAPAVPLDLTVTVRIVRTPLDTPMPRTAEPSPDEPDRPETPTDPDYGDRVFVERFLLRERYAPVVRREVFRDADEFAVRVEAGSSGFDGGLYDVATDEPAEIVAGVDDEGAFVRNVSDDNWSEIVDVPCE